MQVMTLYDSYDEYNIDMDILGKVVSIPQLSRDELKDVVFRELQETHPVPKLEDERYKLSKPVDEDYQIQVENYNQEFEDEDFSVDDLAEGEDPYALGTDSEDLYSIGDVYGLDLNIFSSPFSESEVEQAVSDIESFLHQKVEKFKQNKAEYEKRNVLSVEEVRAMFNKGVQTYEEPEEVEGTLDEDEEMIDTFSSSGVEMIEEDDVPYFISEPDILFIEVDTTKEEDLFVPEPDVSYIEVLVTEEFFIPEPDIPHIEVEGTDTDEIPGTFIDNNAEFFVKEEDIPFIKVYSSEEESGYSDDTDDYTVEEDFNEEEPADEGMVYGEEEEDSDEEDSFDEPEEEDSDEDFNEEPEEEASDEDFNEEYDSYEESDDSEDEEDSYDIESDEDDEPEADFDMNSDDEEASEEDYSTESDEEDVYSMESDEDSEGDYSTESEDEGFDIDEDDSDDFSTDQDESEDDFSTDQDDKEVVTEGTEEEDDLDFEPEFEPEPVLAPPPQIKKRVKESKGSDTLNPRQVSKGSDLEDSFIDKPLAKGTKLTQSTGDREIKNPPRDLVDFLRLYPRTQYSIAVKYYGEKEVKRQIKIGRVYRKGKYLLI